MIVFKDPEDQKDFRKLKKPVMDILSFIEEVVWALEKEPITITSIARSDGSTHETMRYWVVDLGMFSRVDNDWLRDIVNRKFPYQGKKGVMTVAPFDHGTAPHWHVQVYPS